jgi:hypothetical protein
MALAPVIIWVLRMEQMKQIILAALMIIGGMLNVSSVLAETKVEQCKSPSIYNKHSKKCEKRTAITTRRSPEKANEDKVTSPDVPHENSSPPRAE